jgi:F-type H+-transporting ATPase subunit delta
MAGDITTIARPYAEAAFERAKELGQVDAWSEALANMAAVLSDPLMIEQITNPNVPSERIRDIVLDLCGDGLPPEAVNLLRLLAMNGRLSALPEISRLFETSRVADQGVRHVLIRSAFEITADEQNAVASALAKRLGGTVEISVETDRSLIGGIEVRAGDLVIDDSVRGKLQQLAQALQF